MIAEVFINPNVLINFKCRIHKNVVDPKGGRNTAESSPGTPAFFRKCIFQAISNLVICITVGEVIKVATHNYRIWAFIYFPFYVLALGHSF